jgi:predicted O-methyltransferase YrrM
MRWLLRDLEPIVEYHNFGAAVADIEGFLLNVEGWVLQQLAARGPGVGAIVEIGSYQGRSTCWLANGTKAMGREKVTAVDHFEGSPEHQLGAKCESPLITDQGSTFAAFKANIERMGFTDYVQPIVASSAKAVQEWTGPIRLLFIDGDHSYERAQEDFELWSPFVVPEGVMCFHDINQGPGVTRFYNELTATGRVVQSFVINSLAVCQLSTGTSG